jgi:hypothetical protein
MARILYTEIKSGERLVATDITDLTFFPKGTILTFSSAAWSATSVAFKNIWKICDGNNGTPDLRGRFLRGGTSSDAATGGADSTTLTENHIPEHTHGYGTLSATQGTTANTGGNHSHSFSINSIYNDAKWASSSGYLNPDITNPSAITPKSFTTSSAGGHTHSITGNTGSYGKASAAITAVQTVPSYYTVIYIMKVS